MAFGKSNEPKSNVVFWQNQGPDDIIYACPYDDLRTLTSVTVPEHAVALFIRDGQLQGVLAGWRRWWRGPGPPCGRRRTGCRRAR